MVSQHVDEVTLQSKSDFRVLSQTDMTSQEFFLAKR